MHPSIDDPLFRWHSAAAILQARLSAVLGLRTLDMTMIAGSGVMDAFGKAEWIAEIPYRDLDNMPEPTVVGHAHVFRVIELHGVLIGIFGGRYHVYEGHDVSVVLAPVAITHLLNIGHMLISNAAGGLHPRSRVGDVMLVTDVLNATMRTIPPCFPPSRRKNSSVINQFWTSNIARMCAEKSTQVHSGTYVQVAGPSYETRAEIRMARRMGADAIGMSTVLEAQYAHALGISAVACSMITNTLSDTKRTHVSHSEVLDAARQARASMRIVIEAAAESVSLQL